MKPARNRPLPSTPPALSGRVVPFPDRGLELDDEALVGILREGDRRAPQLMWHRFAPMVQRILRRTFGPEHDLDDRVQEVFLVLFARLPTLREPKALTAFVLSITAHTIRRELRRKAALRWLQFGEPPPSRAPAADLDSREALGHLYAILDRLRPGDRTAFVLRHFEGLPLVDVAEAMDVSISTAKRHLVRACERVGELAWRDPALVEFVANLEPESGP